MKSTKGIQISSPLFCPPLLWHASIFVEADDDEIDVKFDCDVLVGDFCSILIIVGVPAENDVASKLFDVVTSDTWHGSRLIWRSVPVAALSPTLFALFTFVNCWRVDEFHAIGNVRLQPAPSNCVSCDDLFWCCWCKFNIQSLIFLLCFDIFDEPRLLLELVGVFDDVDEVELPELIFSDFIAGVVV